MKTINARAATALSTMEQLLLHIYSPAADFFAAAFAMMFVDERFCRFEFGAPVGGGVGGSLLCSVGEDEGGD